MAFRNPKTDEIFRRAKRAALGSKRDRLTIPDLLHAVRILQKEGVLEGEMRSVLDRAHAAIRWPQPVEDLASAASAVSERDAEKQRLQLDDSLNDVIRAVHREDPTLPPGRLVQLLFESQHPAVVEWKRLNAVAPPATIGSMASRLEEAGEAAAKLREVLGSRVLGQDAAIEMLAQAYYRARLSAPAQGPRGIFTFLGPSGVGKTLLAEAFAEELGKLDGHPLPFRRFDMGSFGGHQNFEQLFGAEQFYKGTRPGTLTGFVHENPVSVVLFDEIEKAHENVIRALLAVLDKGMVTDKALDRPISFRDVWIVLTTNLGREFFDSENESGFLRGAGLTSGAVFDLLASARGRLEVGSREAPPALPPEFVSRLAKGGAVVFNRLETSHHLRLAEAHLRVGDGRDDLPEIVSSEDARLLFLLTLLPDLDARRVVAASGAWAADLVKRGWEACRSEALASGPDRLRIEVRCASDALAYFDGQLREGGPLGVVFVDEDAHVAEAAAIDCADLHVAITRIERREDVPRAIARTRPQVVFLDLSIGQGPSSPEVGQAIETLERVRQRHPDLPVYLFSENPERRGAFDEVVARVLGAGGARGFLPCRRDPESAVLAEDFTSRLRAAILETSRAEILRRNVRARQRASFRTRFLWERGTIVAEIHDVREETVVGAQDRSAAIRFAGIPAERFDDVAGLDRAKRRLREVAGFLARPGALAVFGVAPPRGFLLAGPPGTGKTLLARAFAGETGLPFLAFSAGELKSKWYGESEERIREVFERARRYAPSIVFIDEIDAVGRSREAAREGSAEPSPLNQLLASMDGFRSADRPVFVLAATNRPDDLDPALKRPGRFDEVIPIDLPNAAGRGEFFAARLRDVPKAADLDVDAVVRQTVGCAPAELDRIVREAIYRAVADGRDAVSGSDLEEASRLVRFGASREGETMRPEDLRATAWHEAGHALVHLALHPGSRIEYVTVIPTESGALGFTAMEADEDQKDLSANDVRNRLAVLFAGREAERILAGSDDALTTGAGQDLERATRLARKAIARWGFDPEFGPVVVDALDDSERGALSGVLESRLRVWLEEGRSLARSVLDANATALESLAETLARVESMNGEELEGVVGGGSASRADPGRSDAL